MNRTITISLDKGTHSVIAINRLMIGHVSEEYDNFYSLYIGNDPDPHNFISTDIECIYCLPSSQEYIWNNLCESIRNDRALHEVSDDVEYLLKYIDSSYINKHNSNGLTVLYLACLTHNEYIIDPLLEKGANPHIKCTGNISPYEYCTSHCNCRTKQFILGKFDLFELK